MRIHEYFMSVSWAFHKRFMSVLWASREHFISILWASCEHFMRKWRFRARYLKNQLMVVGEANIIVLRREMCTGHVDELLESAFFHVPKGSRESWPSHSQWYQRWAPFAYLIAGYLVRWWCFWSSASCEGKGRRSDPQRSVPWENSGSCHLAPNYEKCPETVGFREKIEVLKMLNPRTKRARYCGPG